MASLLGRIARRLHPGLRQVHAQVARYAAEWEAANGQALAAPHDGPLWVVLGDSTAQGIGAPAWDEGYVGQLRTALDAGGERHWRVVNLSRSGARTTDVLDRQLPALRALGAVGATPDLGAVGATPDLGAVGATPDLGAVGATPALGAVGATPDLVTCAIGANDIVHRTPIPALEARLRDILAGLPAGAIVATVPQGLNPVRTDAANRVIRAEAPAAGLVVADVWAHTGPPWHGKLAADGFHPGALGYADWAAAFAEVLPKALGRRPSEPRQPPHRLGSSEPQ